MKLINKINPQTLSFLIERDRKYEEFQVVENENNEKKFLINLQTWAEYTYEVYQSDFDLTQYQSLLIRNRKLIDYKYLRLLQYKNARNKIAKKNRYIFID
ncbi:hypothetical protein BpHYR1_028102 [Brachionus plicatilis]|uniref:Uncharacterized protein n=1 Tax=Brachionus plicatilis TaxID=10195 RepID=A0A3M7R999_BRAPC|nr:hypothetical protein BpHYR1_028102 [Brachionus plicatilis]